jgi:hypothetical protein
MAKTFLDAMLRAEQGNGPVISLSDGVITLVDTVTAQTLTNKTLTAPVISAAAAASFTSPVITGKPTVYSTDTTISGDGAIDISLGDLFVLTKGSAAAITLADPTAADNGRVITIRSGSAFAHVITLATGIGGVVTTDDVITFTNRASASITLKVINAKWWVVGSYLAAIA